MRTFGTDRLRTGEEGLLHLSARLPKGWKPRVAKTLTSPEHPGTAVLWEEQYYEVLAAEGLPAGGVEYTLAPWRDEHAIRVADRYDPESERARHAAHRAEVKRDRNRIRTNILAIFTGHLPAVVQTHLGNELGTTPATLTIISTLPIIGLMGMTIILLAASMVDKKPFPFPLWIVFVLAGLTLESVIRIVSAWQTGRPLGSLLGTLGYIAYYYLSPRREKLVAPFQVEKGLASDFTIAPEDDVVLRDAFIMREPYLTLLTPEEQARAAQRFGYDYRRLSSKVAALILVAALIGVFSTFASMRANPSIGFVIPLLSAAALAMEQVLRLMSFPKGPASSVLGIVVRPFVRKIL
jgi:hypothetical protein